MLKGKKEGIFWIALPPLLAIIITVSLFFFFLFRSLKINEGQFVYLLDDAYIHLALAKNIFRHHLWGVNPFQFAAASSAPFWVILLSFLFQFHLSPLWPLVINIFSAIGILIAADFLLRQLGLSTIRARLFILISLIFIAPFTALIFSGMEHLFHTFIFLLWWILYLKISTRKESSRGGKAILTLLSFFLGGLRYENFLLLVPLLILILLPQKRRLALINILALFAPTIIIGFYFYRQGGFFLPSSVLLHSQLDRYLQISGWGWRLGAFILMILRKIKLNPYVLFLLFVNCLLWRIAAIKDENSLTAKQRSLFNLSFSALSLLYIVIFNLNNFFRYEAFLVVWGWLLFGVNLFFTLQNNSLQQSLRPLPLRAHRFFLHWLLVIFLFFFTQRFLLRSLSPLRHSLTAMNNIYQQQFQMMRFLKRYYPQAVVGLNDIGLVNFYLDLPSLDLWGLGSYSVLRLRMEGNYTPQTLTQLAQQEKMELAIIYQDWFEKLFNGFPSSWTKVGQWTVPDNVILGGETVSFWSPNFSAAQKLRRNLILFSPFLPSSVEEEIFNLAEK